MTGKFSEKVLQTKDIVTPIKEKEMMRKDDCNVRIWMTYFVTLWRLLLLQKMNINAMKSEKSTKKNKKSTTGKKIGV